MPSKVSSKESLVPRPHRARLFLSVAELCGLTGLTEKRLVGLVRLGVIEPRAPGSMQFTVETAMRLKRMLRLRRELGVGSIGASIIVDLLERIAVLEGRSPRTRG